MQYLWLDEDLILIAFYFWIDASSDWMGAYIIWYDHIKNKKFNLFNLKKIKTSKQSKDNEKDKPMSKWAEWGTIILAIILEDLLVY